VVETVPRPVEVPQWTRHGLPALGARRAAGRPPKLKVDGGNGLVICWDLMRWTAAARLADDLGWPLLTDLFEDWRLRPSMRAWRRHFENHVYPALEGTDRIVSAVSRLAVEGAQAPVIVPNAGFHGGVTRLGSRPAPGRPTAAYVGTIHSRLDVEILAALRAGLGGWDIVVAGPAMDKRVRSYVADANVRIVDWWAMQDIDRLATVVVCPYVRTPYTRSMDPLKVYEALARGVPCVDDRLRGRHAQLGVAGGSAGHLRLPDRQSPELRVDLRAHAVAAAVPEADGRRCRRRHRSGPARASASGDERSIVLLR
jgi:hypothetical protein